MAKSGVQAISGGKALQGLAVRHRTPDLTVPDAQGTGCLLGAATGALEEVFQPVFPRSSQKGSLWLLL